MTDYLQHKIDFDNPATVSIFDEVSLWAARFGLLMLEHLEIKRGIRALDVGFGNGFPLFELAFLHGPSSQFTGVDVWEPAIERAKLKQQVYGVENVELLKIDGRTFPLPDAQFDLIVSNLGVNNFEDPQAVLAECARVAKPDARLVITTNIKGHFTEFYAVYRALLTELKRSDYLARLDANESHRGTRESVTALIENAGFRVVKVVESQFQYLFLDGSAMFRHSIIRLGFLDGWRSVIDPTDEEAIFTTLEDRLNALAQAQGTLVMTVPMLYIEARR